MLYPIELCVQPSIVLCQSFGWTQADVSGVNKPSLFMKMADALARKNPVKSWLVFYSVGIGKLPGSADSGDVGGKRLPDDMIREVGGSQDHVGWTGDAKGKERDAAVGIIVGDIIKAR